MIIFWPIGQRQKGKYILQIIQMPAMVWSVGYNILNEQRVWPKAISNEAVNLFIVNEF